MGEKTGGSKDSKLPALKRQSQPGYKHEIRHGLVVPVEKEGAGISDEEAAAILQASDQRQKERKAKELRFKQLRRQFAKERDLEVRATLDAEISALAAELEGSSEG